MIDSILVLQPPMVQLNAPYPSGAYLSAFFRACVRDGIPSPNGAPPTLPSTPVAVTWVDAANGFSRELFSREGLSGLFDRCGDAALATASGFERDGDEEAAFQLRRFVSSRRRWEDWIDRIMDILTGIDRESCHSFVLSPSAPRGHRMDRFLAGLQIPPTADHARTLATLALEDVADFISVAFDPHFSLVRYAESLATSVRDFAEVEAALAFPMARDLLAPYFARLCASLASEHSGRVLCCVSVPFPGCLVPALSLCLALRSAFGERAVISLGGGYANTELRECRNERFFRYVDHLSLDRGYGSYAAFLSSEWRSSGQEFPRVMTCPDEWRDIEDGYTRSLCPDYSDIDFSRYPRLADTDNPMHRLWSDGAWMKAFLAHGCYWHRCSFCDVSLDYIKSYIPVDTKTLFDGLRAQAATSGVRGVHLVDEAAPPRQLRDLALMNLESGNALTIWGNIRFERAFSRDLADLLSHGGLVGVSGGIEIATPEGFKAVDKGIDLENLVAVCAAFKEAGVLVHAYLIYGYWNETEADVVTSCEVMRQLFAAGLVDSAFWHKFVLTKHSRVYCEWRESGPSRAAGIVPIERAGNFAENDLEFEGQEISSRFTEPLDRALSSWMAGVGLDRPVRSWFPFKVPSPAVEEGLIDSLIARYEKRRDEAWDAPFDPESEYRWVATEPVAISPTTLAWWHLGEEIVLECGSEAGQVLGALRGALRGAAVEGSFLARLRPEVFTALRRNGLVRSTIERGRR